jgi:hypothetical protein
LLRLNLLRQEAESMIARRTRSTDDDEADHGRHAQPNPTSPVTAQTDFFRGILGVVSS